MGRLIYSLNVSLDGFIETTDHRLDWATVDEELHTWFNDQTRTLDASLYGRRLYDVMSAYWPTAGSDPAASEPELEFARLWNAMPIFVFSRSLESVVSNCRLVSGDVGERLAEIRAEFQGDLDVAGPTLAAQFVERGLVDEFRLLVHPVVLGSGTRFFPSLESSVGLRLTDTHTFKSGVVYLGYAVER